MTWRGRAFWLWCDTTALILLGFLLRMGGGLGCCFLRILSRSWLVRCRMLPGGKRGRAEGNRGDFRGRGGGEILSAAGGGVLGGGRGGGVGGRGGAFRGGGGGKILSAAGEAVNLDPFFSGIVMVPISRDE